MIDALFDIVNPNIEAHQIPSEPRPNPDRMGGRFRPSTAR